MKNHGLLLLVTLILAPTSAGQTGPESQQDPGSTTTPGSLSRGQQMVNRFVANHPELAALEIALMSRDGGCSTVAASSPDWATNIFGVSSFNKRKGWSGGSMETG